MLRRLFLPALLAAVAIFAVMQARGSNDAADPGRATATNTEPSLATPILSARRAPAWVRDPKSDALLADAVSSALATDSAPSDLCVVVERNGTQITANNIGAPIRAGDLHRLITATVIDSVGSGSGFRTEVAYASEAELRIDEETNEAELIGDIWIIGGGDPVLQTSAYVGRYGDDRAFTNFDQLLADTVQALQNLNVVEVQGRVIGDETKYSPIERSYYDARWEDAEGNAFDVWDDDDGLRGSIGPLSALMVNDGFEDWNPEAIDPGANDPARNPAVFAAEALDNALEEAGIRVRRSASDGEAPPLADRETLAVIDSPPLGEIIERSLVDSTTAEMLLKETGVRSGLGPERAQAIFGLGVDGFVQAGLPYAAADRSTLYHDGSGRSALNRTTCEMIHATIAGADSIGASIIPDLADSAMATCRPPGGPEIAVFATAAGSTTGLAGHLTADNGDIVTFAMLADDPGRFEIPEGSDATEPLGPFTECNDLQTAMLGAVAAHPYGPTLDELSPHEPGS